MERVKIFVRRLRGKVLLLKGKLLGAVELRAFKKDPDEFWRHSRYGDLEHVPAYSPKKYVSARDYLSGKTLIMLSQRFGAGEKIRIAFLTYSSSQWCCQGLYELFRQDSRFEAFAIVCGYVQMPENERESTRLREQELLRQFGVECRDAHDSAVIGESGVNADILFYLTPYILAPDIANIVNQKLTSLIVSLPYGFFLESQFLSDGTKKFDHFSYQASWRYFCDSLYYKETMEEYARCGASNVEFLGYPKMDDLLKKLENPALKASNCLWKTPEGAEGGNIVKIIYAPHHSLDYGGDRAFATFGSNYQHFLKLAKSTQKSTSWVLKPHPLLRTKAVVSGVFADEEAFDNYMEEWENLPNARVSWGGSDETAELFRTSDVLILDSISFLAEYMFTGKPQLFLTRASQHFGRFGEDLVSTLYQVEGDSETLEEEVAGFIDEVVIKGNDSKKTERDGFFRRCLDYRSYNQGLNASQAIYNRIVNSLGDSDGDGVACI